MASLPGHFLAVAVIFATMAPTQNHAQSAAATVIDDAVPTPLTTIPGDVARGRIIVGNRQAGLCLLCHSGPFPTPLQGTLAPNLSGAGSRWSVGQLRSRIVDARHANPDTIMPPYFSTDGLARVAPAFQGRALFTAQQVEDVVAFLATLRE